MATQKRSKKDNLIVDYNMLISMSKMLKEHQKKVALLGKKIAKRKITTDLEDGLIENLDIVREHMQNAQKEIDRASRRLKMI